MPKSARRYRRRSLDGFLTMTVLMQRTLLAAALVFGVMSFSPTVGADSKRAEAQALLEKTDKISALTGMGSEPFELQLTMKYGAPARPTAATVFLVWENKKAWR